MRLDTRRKAIQSDNPAFDHLNISNVEVRVIGEKPGLIVNETGTGTKVLEGGTGDTYTLALTAKPNAGETVSVQLNLDPGVLAVGAGDPSQAGRFNATTRTITFNDSNWNTPFVVSVNAPDDHIVGNSLVSNIAHQITSSQAGGVYASVLDKPQVSVDVVDKDIGGLLVTQSGGSTIVSAGHPDTYTLQLTKQPTAAVTVSILTDGKTLVSADPSGALPGRFGTAADATPTVTFDASNWNIAFTVSVAVNPAGPGGGTGQPVETFPSQPHLTSQIRGPLVIDGSPIPGRDRSLKPGVKLPTELDVPLPVVSTVVDEGKQVDTLNVFNDGSHSNDTGSLGHPLFADGLAAIYGVPTIGFDLSRFENISGINMGGNLPLNFGTTAHPDVRTIDGGITYANLEVNEISLGTGNDSLDASSSTLGMVVFGGDGRDTINGGAGADMIFGDRGHVDYFNSAGQLVTRLGMSLAERSTNPLDPHFVPVKQTDGGLNERIIAATRDPQAGDVDTIDGGAGNDVIMGGAGGDTITARIGGKIILGDFGEADLFGATNDVFSTDTGLGGNDTIIGGADGVGNIMIGGAGADLLSGGSGNDVILGDSGYVHRDAANVVTQVNTIDPAVGGNDTITGGAGTDVIMGGAGDDLITAPLGGKIILGDNGVADLAGGDRNVYSTDPSIGGVDTITGGADGVGNIIIGGAMGDFISGGSGDDVILGDSGYVQRAANGSLIKVYTIAPDTGGDDNIQGGAGNDVIMGGAGNDLINAPLGGKIILGDNGEAHLANWLDDAGVLHKDRDVFSTDPEIGGVDHIVGGADGVGNIILGGAEGDFIWGGSGNDVILGDSGYVQRAEDRSLVRVYTIAPAIGGIDHIEGGDGFDFGFAAQRSRPVLRDADLREHPATPAVLLHRGRPAPRPWPVEPRRDTREAFGPLGEDLIGMTRSSSHYIEDQLQIRFGHVDMKQIGHAVDEDEARTFPM